MPDRRVLTYIPDGSEYHRPVDDAIHRLQEVAGDSIHVIILGDCPWDGPLIEWQQHPYITRQGMYDLVHGLIAECSGTST